MIKKTVWAAGILVVVLAAYLGVWPVPIEAVAWKAPAAPGSPLPKRYGHVMAFSEYGRVVADLQDPSGVYPETTGATETVDRLYVPNLHLRVLGWKAR